MFFKNALVYVLHGDHDLPTQEQLEVVYARDITSSEAVRCGWTVPFGIDSKLLSRTVSAGGRTHMLLAMRRQERKVPKAVVQREAAKRVAEREAAEERVLPRVERREIKEQVYEELLPRAFVNESRAHAWIDLGRQRIVVDSTSRKRAEELLDLLRQTMGSLKVTPLATQALPMLTMTEWLKEEVGFPVGISGGDHVVLEAKGDDGAITGRKVDLSADDIQASLAAGRLARRLGISMEGMLSCVLHDDLAMKQIRFADELQDEAAASDAEDALERLDTDFILMVGALSKAIDELVEVFGGLAQITQPATQTGEAALPSDEAASDPLYPEAEAFVVAERRPSISAIQRHLKLGYNRSARLLEAMQAAGVVSAPDGQGRRTVFKANPEGGAHA